MAEFKKVGHYYIVGHPNHYAIITEPDYFARSGGNNRLTPKDFTTAEAAEEFVTQYMLKNDR